MSDTTFTRRQALGGVGALLVGSTAGSAHQAAPPQSPRTAAAPARLAPREDLVNVPEFEEMARLKLAAAAFAPTAGGDRHAFDFITLRPRMAVPTLDLDLSQDLFGEKLFAPILVGPIADQKRFHPDGELATVRGASAARAVMIVSSRSSVPIDQLAAGATTSLWYQVYASDPRGRIDAGLKAGCKAVCITVGAAPGAADGKATADPQINWAAVDQLRQGLSVPVVIKGITTPAEAKLALQHGAQGIVVSNHGGLIKAQAPIAVLPAIVDAVAGKAAVLVDGSFRRGSDIIKALAFGAQGVLLGRPAIWGLAAYGADGVQTVVELLQSELARTMGMCGKINLKALDRTVLAIHTRATS